MDGKEQLCCRLQHQLWQGLLFTCSECSLSFSCMSLNTARDILIWAIFIVCSCVYCWPPRAVWHPEGDFAECLWWEVWGMFLILCEYVCVLCEWLPGLWITVFKAQSIEAVESWGLGFLATTWLSPFSLAGSRSLTLDKCCQTFSFTSHLDRANLVMQH